MIVTLLNSLTCEVLCSVGTDVCRFVIDFSHRCYFLKNRSIASVALKHRAVCLFFYVLDRVFASA